MSKSKFGIGKSLLEGSVSSQLCVIFKSCIIQTYVQNVECVSIPGLLSFNFCNAETRSLGVPPQ